MAATPDTRPQTPFVPNAAQLAAGIGIDNLPAVRVADPAVQAAIQYLIGLGAPPPTSQEDDVEGFPGGSYMLSLVIWTNATTGQTVTAEAGYMAAKPGTTAVLLAYAGIITLPAGFQAMALTPYQVAAMLPPPVASVPVVMPASPVGPPIYPGFVAVSAPFYVSPTDSLTAHPIGSTWVDDGKGVAPVGQYLKTGTVGPFGPSISWNRTK